MQPPFKQIVIATRNAGKVKEFARMFADLQVEVRSLLDYEAMPDIVEDGATFADNALIKAKTIAEKLGIPVLADDSGLCVDALDGAPGVYSARYAGEHAGDAENNAKLLQELRRIGAAAEVRPDDLGASGASKASVEATEAAGGVSADSKVHPSAHSTGRFVCALALYDPEREETLTVEGACEGYILTAPRGENGFGYDPLFYLPEYGKTMAELALETKNELSHRARALVKLLEVLRKS